MKMIRDVAKERAIGQSQYLIRSAQKEFCRPLQRTGSSVEAFWRAWRAAPIASPLLKAAQE